MEENYVNPTSNVNNGEGLTNITPASPYHNYTQLVIVLVLVLLIGAGYLYARSIGGDASPASRSITKEESQLVSDGSYVPYNNPALGLTMLAPKGWIVLGDQGGIYMGPEKADDATSASLYVARNEFAFSADGMTQDQIREKILPQIVADKSWSENSAIFNTYNLSEGRTLVSVTGTYVDQIGRSARSEYFIVTNKAGKAYTVSALALNEKWPEIEGLLHKVIFSISFK